MHQALPSSAVPRSADLPPALCILGLGLIGGSLARAAQPLIPVIGWSPSEGTRAAAAGDGYEVADSLETALGAAVERDALVVLAAPVTAFRPLLSGIDEHRPEVRLTDVASVKAVVQDDVAELAPRARYIGSHPMAGTAASGWSAGTDSLFRGAAWVTCLTDDSDIDDWATVAGLALAVGSRVVPADPLAHDAAVARISHLPHLMALALAQVGEHGGALALSLAASSFADATRVAGTRPELIRAMCETNREALIEAMDDALGDHGRRPRIAGVDRLAAQDRRGRPPGTDRLRRPRRPPRARCAWTVTTWSTSCSRSEQRAVMSAASTAATTD